MKGVINFMGEEKKKHPGGRPLGSKCVKRQAAPVRVSETELDSIDQAIIRLEQARPGISNREIGEIVDVYEKTVSRRRKREIYQSVIRELNKSALEIIKEGQVKAARVLGELLEHGEGKIRLEAARILLRPLLPATVDVTALVAGEPCLKRMSDDELKQIVAGGVKSIDDSKTKTGMTS